MGLILKKYFLQLYNTIQVLLSLTTILYLELDQMDVTTAFLNGDHDKEIYIGNQSDTLTFIIQNLCTGCAKAFML